MRIKNFLKFCESVSGTELIGHVGPNYGDQILPVTLSKSDTEIIFSDLTDKFYTYDDYTNLYNDYLKNGGSPLNDTGFNKTNLEGVLNFLNTNDNKV